MKKFGWVITENERFIIVSLNGGINCMLFKNHESLEVSKKEVLQDIEFSKSSNEVTVKGIELLN